MLEVMNAVSTDLSRSRGDHGVLLNCWNKTSPLIKELERTVNFAERKCGDLMQQLHFYKEYYEKWTQFERVSNLCNKKKEKKFYRQTADFGSSSENEFEKANQYLYKKIKSKIKEMNNEITQANQKIHSKTRNFVQSPEICCLSYLQPEENLEEANPHFSAIPNKSCKSEPLMKTSSQSCNLDTGGIKVTEKNSSNSVPTRKKLSKNVKKDSGSSKRRYASLQRYKIRSKSLPQGVRRKFGFGGFFEVFEPDRININSRTKSKTSLKASSCRSKKSKTRLEEMRKLTPKSSRYRLSRSKSDIRHSFRNTKSESLTKKHENTQQMNAAPQTPTAKEINACTSIIPSNRIKDTTKTEFALCSNLKTLMAKPNTLLPFLRNPIPFIPCSSTSRSFNLGLNVQQVLSLIKRKRHSVTLQAVVRSSMQAARSITEPTVNTLFISQTTTSHSHVTSSICPAKEASEDSCSVAMDDRSKCSILKQVQTMRSHASEGKLISPRKGIELSKAERPEDVWVVEQPDPRTREIKNSRSRCTCFPSKHCVDYNKVLKQYTGWKLPSDTLSSYIYTKSKLYSTPSKENINLSGRENDAGTEVTKAQNGLLNLSRKYTTLQKQIMQNSLDDYEANVELDAMESELALKEVELRDILNFYNQLIALKEKLKTLRTRIGPGQSAARQSEGQRPKKNPLRQTPSMALAKVLKKIQGLQDKIKLIDAP